MNKKLTVIFLIFVGCCVVGMAGHGWGAFVQPGQSGEKERPMSPPDTVKSKKTVDIPDVEIDEEEIPDSLLHPRWKV